jgi:cell division protein FtsI (penicillin-binding protein 3)
VGFAPASNPRVIIAVMIDEPSAGEHYGGTVAAPIFARIASDTMRTLRVTPDIPLRAETDSGAKSGSGSGPVPGMPPTSKTARAPARSRGNA